MTYEYLPSDTHESASIDSDVACLSVRPERRDPRTKRQGRAHGHVVIVNGTVCTLDGGCRTGIGVLGRRGTLTTMGNRALIFDTNNVTITNKNLTGTACNSDFGLTDGNVSKNTGSLLNLE